MVSKLILILILSFSSVGSFAKDKKKKEKEVQVVKVPGQYLNSISCKLKKDINLTGLKLRGGRFSLTKDGVKNFDNKDRKKVCHIEVSDSFTGKVIKHKDYNLELQSSKPNKFSEVLGYTSQFMLFYSTDVSPIESIKCFKKKEKKEKVPKHLSFEEYAEMVSEYFDCKVVSTNNLKIEDSDEIQLRQVWKMKVIDSKRSKVVERIYLDDFESKPFDEKNQKNFTETKKK